MQQPDSEGDHILVSPLWVFICRIFQVIVALIILALAARLMHDAYLDEEGLALAIVSPCLLYCLEDEIQKHLTTPTGHHHLDHQPVCHSHRKGPNSE